MQYNARPIFQRALTNLRNVLRVSRWVPPLSTDEGKKGSRRLLPFVPLPGQFQFSYNVEGFDSYFRRPTPRVGVARRVVVSNS